MSPRFESVLYATPEKVNRMVKFKATDDRGSLAVSSDGVQFVGRKLNLTARRIVAVSLARQQIPWPSYAVLTLVCIPLFAMIYSLPLAEAVVLVIAGDLFGLWVAVSTKWVRVDYQDESGSRRSAYFADGSKRGWGGIFGGTNVLYRAIVDSSHVGELPSR
jgi:hypothetical protein